MKTKLITTKVKTTYNGKESKYIYLGTWCLDPIIKKKNIFKKNHNILKHHWNNSQSMKKDMRYIHNKYETALPLISDYLNTYHKTNHSKKYWKFLVGPWLFLFINIFFDRLKLIEKVKNKYSNFETEVTDQKFIPNTYSEHYDICTTHEYNFILFSDIIKLFPSIKKKYIEIELNRKKKNIKINLKKNISKFLKILKNINFIFKKNYRKNNTIELVSSDLSLKEQIEIFKKLKQNYYPIFKSYDVNSKFIINERPILKNKKIEKKDKFLKYFFKVMLNHFPAEYLEGYKHLLSESKKIGLAIKPKKIVIRAPGEFSSMVRFYCAQKLISGAKIYGFQHGGGYGMKTYIGIEEFERNLVHKYFTWGWDLGKFKRNLIKFFVSKTHSFQDVCHNNKGKVLLVHGALRNYYFYPPNYPPSFNQLYLKQINFFFNHLSLNVKKNLLSRFHFNFGATEEKYLKKLSPNYSSRDQSSHFFHLQKKAKLMIVTTDFTSYLQNFLMNLPTVLLFEKNFSKVNKASYYYYKKLIEAKILFYDAKKCAEHINKIYENPMIWWKNKKTQKAKDIFCTRFARHTVKFSSEFVKVISKN